MSRIHGLRQRGLDFFPNLIIFTSYAMGLFGEFQVRVVDPRKRTTCFKLANCLLQFRFYPKYKNLRIVSVVSGAERLERVSLCYFDASTYIMSPQIEWPVPRDSTH